MVGKKMIPPDGGWGWAIVIAYALNNVIMVPILQSFSLVLKDIFIKLEIAATDASVIISVNSAFGMAVGLIHGPLLRNFGYRKIAFLGSTIFVLGITLTAFATTFSHFMITYGLMASFGVGLTMSSFSLAVNTYFVQKRGRALGIAMTVTGLGPIIMPQLISFLLAFYGTQGTTLILGALALHSLVATMLLQPVKWHAKWEVEVPENEESKPLNEVNESGMKSVKDVGKNVADEREKFSGKKTSSTNADNEQKQRNGMNVKQSTNSHEAEGAIVTDTGSRRRKNKWWNSGKSSESVNLGSSALIFEENMNFGHLVIDDDDDDDDDNKTGTKSIKEIEAVLRKDVKLAAETNLLKKDPAIEEKVIPEKSSCSCWQKMINFRKHSSERIVQFFDLNLLRDPIYVNMMFGMSIALFAEINFAVLTPFILGDMELDTNKIAIVMSTLAGVDLVSRGLVPFLGEWLRLPARHMALLSLFFVICCRTMLIFTSSFTSVLLIAIGIGIAKGIRAVNMSLVIPNYIPIERLASATGIQMVANGLVLMALGPLLGLSRDKFGTYIPSLILINSTTAITIIMWVTEMCIVSRSTKRKQQYEAVNVRA